MCDKRSVKSNLQTNIILLLFFTAHQSTVIIPMLLSILFFPVLILLIIFIIRYFTLGHTSHMWQVEKVAIDLPTLAG